MVSLCLTMRNAPYAQPACVASCRLATPFSCSPGEKMKFVLYDPFFPPVPQNWRLIVHALRRVERRAINNSSRRFLHVGFIARSKGYATPDGHVSASGTGFHEDGRGVRIEMRGPIKARSRSKGNGITRG